MRAILFGSLAEGVSKISDYLQSPDTNAMIEAMRQLGATIHVGEKRLEIYGVNGELKPCDHVIDAGNSGQVLRFVGSLAALLPTCTVITGDHSIRTSRPIQPLLTAITQLKGFAAEREPLLIQGPIQPGMPPYLERTLNLCQVF